MNIREHFGQGVDSSISLTVALLVLTAITACADSGMNNSSRARTTIDTLGDTITVHTISGSIWGEVELTPELRIGALEGAEYEIFGRISGLQVDSDGNIYVLDGQVPALRKYTDDGQYATTLGREGGGPGEYARPDGGLTVLTDGRVLLRDPGNARITAYASDGEYRESWPIRGGRFTSTPMYSAPDGGFLNSDFSNGTTRFVRYAADGSPGDTLSLPERELEPPTLTAASESSAASTPVPFTDQAQWTWHPDGYHVSSVSEVDRYAIDLMLPSGTVRRLTKSGLPVPVSAEERRALEEALARTMQRIDPAWRWNGPPIPEHKPLLRSLFTGKDGRIWAWLHQPGELIQGSDTGLTRSGQRPIPRFREPIAFDAFESDGFYLGRITPPGTFSIAPQPVFHGDFIWAVERDELGVQYVVRYRITPITTN